MLFYKDKEQISHCLRKMYAKLECMLNQESVNCSYRVTDTEKLY